MGRRFVGRILVGSMGSLPPATSYEGCSEKKKQVEDWEKAKWESDSIWGTPFNGFKAIAKRHDVAVARLKRYVDRNMKHNHSYDTDSSTLGGDSRSDDSWDGDSDATM